MRQLPVRIGYGKNIPFPPVEFPPYERGDPNDKHNGNNYPKHINVPADDAYIAAFRQKNSYLDERSGKICYICAAPKVGAMVSLLATDEMVQAGYAEAVGEPVTFNDAEHEQNFMTRFAPALNLPAAAPALSGLVNGGSGNPEVDRIKRENAEMAALLEENARLKAQLGGDAKPKRPYRRRAQAGEPAQDASDSGPIPVELRRETPAVDAATGSAPARQSFEDFTGVAGNK
jgi:hypothetical protein